MTRIKHLLFLPILFAALLLGFACFAGPSILEHYLVVTEPVDRADALVVMAGQRGERLPPVARFYHEGVAPRILLANDGVFAGWSRKYQRNIPASRHPGTGFSPFTHFGPRPLWVNVTHFGLEPFWVNFMVPTIITSGVTQPVRAVR